MPVGDLGHQHAERRYRYATPPAIGKRRGRGDTAMASQVIVGRQGGATARALLAAGVSVRAVTCTPCCGLRARLPGCGDRSRRPGRRPQGLQRRRRGVRMMTPHIPHGPNGEIGHGIAIAEAARDAAWPIVVAADALGFRNLINYRVRSLLHAVALVLKSARATYVGAGRLNLFMLGQPRPDAPPTTSGRQGG